MKISYLDCKGEYKLFSFFRHDYKEWKSSTGEHFMIDGGQDAYFRYSHPDIGKEVKDFIKEAEISEVIADIREQFYWTKKYDKNHNRIKSERALLKDLETDHIYGILKYFTERIDEENPITADKEWKIIHLIFIEELIYRNNEKR